jgi:ribosomal protein L22
MTGFTVSKKAIDKKVGDSKKFREAARKIANDKIKKAKEIMLKEFDSHPITRELDAGPDGANMSNTLDGYGNLFSFMGFSSGSKPTIEVRQFLEMSIRLKRGTNARNANSISREFLISMPTIEDFNFASMPWESGNSWVKSVERGMSSFSYYMHKAHQASRAGVGIQIDNKLRGRASAPTKYMSLILNNFRKRLTG